MHLISFVIVWHAAIQRMQLLRPHKQKLASVSSPDVDWCMRLNCNQGKLHWFAELTQCGCILYLGESCLILLSQVLKI